MPTVPIMPSSTRACHRIMHSAKAMASIPTIPIAHHALGMPCFCFSWKCCNGSSIVGFGWDFFNLPTGHPHCVQKFASEEILLPQFVQNAMNTLHSILIVNEVFAV